MMRSEKTFTGRDALLWILAFFGVITLVNVVMIWFALTTMPEVVSEVGQADVIAEVRGEAGDGTASWPI